MNRLLVTGANGFVGSALCAALLKQGFAVRGAVRRVGQLPDGCEAVVVGDIGAGTDWAAALAGVDVVVHLAARVHVMRDTEENPLAAFRAVNTDGTLRLADEAARIGAKRLVYVSTIKVNGEETDQRPKTIDHRQQAEDRRPRKAEDGHALNFGHRTEGSAYTEEDEPLPEDAYGISKWEAEQELRKVEKETGLAVTIIRLPLVYGPGVKANFLQLMKAVNRGWPLPFGSIDNRRSLIGLGNLVDAIITCVTNPKAAGQTYLMSDGEDVSTPELVRRIAKALGKPARLLPVPVWLLRMAGTVTGRRAAVDRLVGSLVVDSGKIRRELGWTPPVTMEEGLAETAKWFLKRS